MYVKGMLSYHRNPANRFRMRWQCRMRINAYASVKAFGPTKGRSKRNLRKLVAGSSLEKYVR